MITRRRFAAVLLGTVLLAAHGTPAFAQEGVAAAKASGLIGERPDGLLGLVTAQVPADVRALVDRVNAERRAQYQQVAQSTGRSLQEVQAVAGQRLVQATPAGQFVMDGAGQWQRK